MTIWRSSTAWRGESGHTVTRNGLLGLVPVDDLDVGLGEHVHGLLGDSTGDENLGGGSRDGGRNAYLGLLGDGGERTSEELHC